MVLINHRHTGSTSKHNQNIVKTSKLQNMSICQYLAEKSVHTLLKSALIEVCLHKPEDPIAFLAQHLAALNSSKSKPQRKRRGAVSAEPLRYDASVVSPVVIPKDAETAARLRQVLFLSIMVCH